MNRAPETTYLKFRYTKARRRETAVAAPPAEFQWILNRWSKIANRIRHVIVEKVLEAKTAGYMFRVPSLNGLRKNRRRGTVEEARCSVLSPQFLPKVFPRKFGKNIDGVGKRVLLRPSQDGGSTKVESAPVSGGKTLGSFGNVLRKDSSNVFGKSVDEG